MLGPRLEYLFVADTLFASGPSLVVTEQSTESDKIIAREK